MQPPVAIESTGNDLFPLPPDYNSLTKEGRRKARINACRQWRIPGQDALSRANGYAASLDFFDLYYLNPDDTADFDPMFYDMEPLPSPTYHWNIARQWATQRLCIAIAPRGGAKSFLVRKSLLMEMIVVPMLSITYATSTLDNAKMTGQCLKDQYANNDRISDDWAREFPDARILPKRGEAPTGTLQLHLKNGSWIRCISADTRQRGMRPRRYVLDDPEFDPKASTSMQLIRDYMHTLLFNMVLPMVMRPDSSVRWLATFVSKRHYAWHAMDVDEQGLSKDPLFNNWNRLRIDAEWQDAEGERHSCWPELWPPTRAKRLEWAQTDSNYDNVVSLEEIEELVGTPAYLAEYRAQPGEGDEVHFPSLKEREHGYEIVGVDEHLDTAAYKSEARIRYWTHTKGGEDGQWKRVDYPLSTFCKQARLFMSVDTSYSSGPDSDSKVCTLMAVTAEQDLVVLDMWSGRCQQNVLVDAVMRMADKWHCPSVHAEGIRDGLHIYNELLAVVATRATEMVGNVQHLPKIAKFNPGMAAKEAKIASLHRWFEHSKIKLPLSLRTKSPWRELFSQIEEFNPDAPNGGLQHDDELDTVSMVMFILKGRLTRLETKPPDNRTPLQRLKDGETLDKMGLPIGMGIDWRTVPMHDVLEVLHRDERNVRPSNGRTRV